MNEKYKKLLSSLSFFLVTTVISITILFPTYWMISSSFKTDDDLFNPLALIPLDITLRSYVETLSDPIFYFQLRNSLIIALGTAALTLLISLPAGYSLSRLKFKGMSIYSRLILFTYLVPASLLVVPYFALVVTYGLYNTHISIILADTVFITPYCLLVLREYFRAIPKEIEESALIDGASRTRVILSVVLPLSGPALAAIATLAFIYAWNEYLYVIALIGTTDMYTVPVAIAGLVGSDIVPWGKVFAMSTIFSIPSVIFYLIVERYIVAGLTAGAIKG